MTLSPLQGAVDRGIAAGAFEVAGAAYKVKTLSSGLINFLEEQGVRFQWQWNGLDVEQMHLDRPMGHAARQEVVFGKFEVVVYCAGVSAGPFWSGRGEMNRMQGILGCWADIPNPGVTQACKILGPEPVNFINVTPVDDRLLVSGGYAFVGNRNLQTAAQLSAPTIAAFNNEVERWLGVTPKAGHTATCIRPSFPSGVPDFSYEELSGVLVIHNMGQAAGGFTQAPLGARDVAGIIESHFSGQPVLT